MKRIVILGSTGSIGKSALRVVEALPECLQVVGLAVERHVARMLEQALRFNVKNVAVANPVAAKQCVQQAPAGLRIFQGCEGVSELAALDGVDAVLCAIVGMAGLAPVLAALAKGTDVALATKEVLVAAGKIVTETAVRHGACLFPVDSEHSAVFQCLDGKARETVKRIVLTASGGPFGQQPEIDLDRVTIAQALNHPRWNMGKKVSVDSATLMNKGLEIMEARWLFDLPLEKIDVVIHSESIVHSIVEFVDGTMMAQMNLPDMRFAIQYALTYPDRVDGHLPQLDLSATRTLHFSAPDESRFPCLALAREAATQGGSLPVVLNAANEVAVRKFLDGRMTFSGIWQTVERVMQQHTVIAAPSLDEIIEADGWARTKAEEN